MTDWAEIIRNVSEDFWTGFISFVPHLVSGLVVLIVGWFIALALGKIVATILYRIKFNTFFEGERWKKAMERAQIRINPSEFLGAIVKWVVFIVAIWMTAEMLKFDAFAELMKDVVGYLPNVIIAVLVFIVAVIIADILSKIVIAATERTDFPYAKSMGTVVKFAIWVIAVFIILSELEIAREFLLTLFIGMVAFLSLAGGLAFGLGGKDAAADFIEELRKKFK